MISHPSGHAPRKTDTGLYGVLEEHRQTADLLRRMVAERVPVGTPVRLPLRAGGGVGAVGGYLANAPDVVRVIVQRPAMSGGGAADYPVDVLANDLLDLNPA